MQIWRNAYDSRLDRIFLGSLNIEPDIFDHGQIIFRTPARRREIIPHDQAIGPGKKGKGLQISEISLTPARDLDRPSWYDEPE